MAVINDYASFNKWIFIAVNAIVGLLLLRINWLSLRNIITRRINIMKKLVTTSIVMSLLGGVGAYYLFRLDVNVMKITGGNASEPTVANSRFIVADTSIATINDLNGQKVGVMQENGHNAMAKQQLAGSNVEATFMLYEDYPSLVTALVNGEVAGAVLPSDYESRLSNHELVGSMLKNLKSIGDVSLENANVQVGNTAGTTMGGNDIDLTTTPFTVLIAGVDDGRSDALMVASFNPISLRLTLTSIPRDAYVPIACYAGNAKDKINSAHAVSRDCMINTVEDLLDIEIDFFFESNFKGVVEIVDALGGITINSPVEFDAQNSDPERGHFTEHIYKGEQRVDGEGALAFARERHAFASGDFARQQNQQQVIQAILMEAMRMNDLNTMMNVLDAAGNNVTTNLSIDQLVGLFNYIMKKAARFPSQQHIEEMIDVVNSRITAYNSYLWNEANYQTVSIVVLWDGSIKAAGDVIRRNLDLTAEPINHTAQTFDASMSFNQPIISYDVYDEPQFEPELTDSYWCYIGNGEWNNGTCACPGGGAFEVGKGCSAAPATPTPLSASDQASCNALGGLFVWSDSSCYTSCPAGTSADGIGGCVGA